MGARETEIDMDVVSNACLVMIPQNSKTLLTHKHQAQAAVFKSWHEKSKLCHVRTQRTHCISLEGFLINSPPLQDFQALLLSVASSYYDPFLADTQFPWLTLSKSEGHAEPWRGYIVFMEVATAWKISSSMCRCIPHTITRHTLTTHRSPLNLLCDF